MPIEPVQDFTQPGSSAGGVNPNLGDPRSTRRGYRSDLTGFSRREFAALVRTFIPPPTPEFRGGEVSSLTLTGSGTYLTSPGYIDWPLTGAHITSEAPSSLTLFKNVTIPGDLTLSGLTSGSVVFAGAGGIISQDNPNFFWNDSLNRLGIAVNTPNSVLEIAAAGGISDFRISRVGNQAAYTFLTSVAGANNQAVIGVLGVGVMGWNLNRGVNIGTFNGLAAPANGLIMPGFLGVGASTLSGQAHIDQNSATGAIPTLFLNQADVSEEMIEFNTTIGVGNAIEAIGAKTLTTTHFIKVTLPGGLTRYIPAGTIA